jgi:hypothetical protein
MPNVTIRAIHPAVQAKLIGSGHYQLAPDGKLLSAHFGKKITIFRRSSFGYLTPLIAGGPQDIEAGEHPVYQNHLFPAVDNGLSHSVRIEAQSGSPVVYVMDSHTLAYFAWEESLAMEHITQSSILIHIDLHRDGQAPYCWPNHTNLAEAAAYTKNHLEANTFILPAIYQGTVSEFWWFKLDPNQDSICIPHASITGELIHSQASIQRVYQTGDPDKRILPAPTKTLGDLLAANPIRQRIILDIDIDAIVAHHYSRGLPDTDSLTRVARSIALLSRQAGVVTIATSPGYTHHPSAILAARQITQAITELPA